MSDEKKIIIDEDWKSRVAAEKDAAARESQAPSHAHPSGEAASAPEPAMPPASFEMLVTTLATEAMIGLGQISHPLTGKMHVDPAQARYAIDMLEMLADKTKGNLTPAEDRGLRELLHQLRMAFVAAEAVSGQPSAVRQTEENPSTSSG